MKSTSSSSIQAETHRHGEPHATARGRRREWRGATHHRLHFLIDAGNARAAHQMCSGDASAAIETEADRGGALRATAARLRRILLMPPQVRRHESRIVAVAVGT